MMHVNPNRTLFFAVCSALAGGASHADDLIAGFNEYATNYVGSLYVEPKGSMIIVR